MNKDRQRITLIATSISYVLVISDTSIVNVGSRTSQGMLELMLPVFNGS
jgi:hypothetical protein